MRHSLVPVLLLAAVALSCSNVLAMLPTSQQESETLSIDGQQYDNTFSNKFNTANVLNNILYTIPFGTFQVEETPKKMSKYINTNNNRDEEITDAIITKKGNYDDEGFRKKQWHNYPRQLDRLHRYLFEHTDIKQSPDSNDPDHVNTPITAFGNIDDIGTNQFQLNSNEGAHNIYDAVIAASNPLLIFKIHLACLGNEDKHTGSAEYHDLQSYEPDLKNNLEDKGEEETLFTNEINPAMKVKREGIPLETDIPDETSGGRKSAVNKRLFSLWSRLQTLSHKGHELPPHRRHLHAFYGLPDGDGGGGGILTAETRATLMRPPGSPLRWG